MKKVGTTLPPVDADFFGRDKLHQDRPCIWVMIGCSRTGKTMWTNRTLKDCPNTVILCRDDFRRAVGIEYHKPFDPFLKVAHEVAVKAVLIRGFNVIVDGTHLTQSLRLPWIKLAKELDVDLYFVEISIPMDIKRWQRVAEEDNFLWSVIEWQLERMEPLTLEEHDAARRVIYIPNCIDQEATYVSPSS